MVRDANGCSWKAPHMLDRHAHGDVDPLGATPAFAGDAKRGEPMFQRYCSGCHGVDGRGGGKNFMPHVGALMRPGHTELLEDDYLARIITDGGEAYGKSAYMPAF